MLQRRERVVDEEAREGERDHAHQVRPVDDDVGERVGLAIRGVRRLAHLPNAFTVT